MSKNEIVPCPMRCELGTDRIEVFIVSKLPE